MDSRQYTLIIKGKSAIDKLDSLGRRKGEYVSVLIEKDIEIEELRKRVAELEKKVK